MLCCTRIRAWQWPMLGLLDSRQLRRRQRDAVIVLATRQVAEGQAGKLKTLRAFSSTI